MTDAHTHIRATMWDKWHKIIRYEHKWIDKGRNPLEFVSALKIDLAASFIVESYKEDYGFDRDGHTTYYKINFKFYDETDVLTVHVFSDYCSDFVEGDKPPF